MSLVPRLGLGSLEGHRDVHPGALDLFEQLDGGGTVPLQQGGQLEQPGLQRGQHRLGAHQGRAVPQPRLHQADNLTVNTRDRSPDRNS